MTDETIDKLILKCYDIMGVPQPTEEELPEISYGIDRAVKYGKLQLLCINIHNRQMVAKCPKKLRRAWKNYRRKFKKYLNSY